MENESHEELKFHNWFCRNQPKKFTNIESEVSLYDAYCVIGKDFNYGKPGENGTGPGSRVIGRIDLVFTYNRVRYVTEIKYYKNPKKFEFWDALKTIGYCEYLNWQRGVNDDKYKPAIMAPEKKYMLEHLMIASKLNIALFAVRKLPDGFHVYKIEDGMDFIRNSRKTPGK